MDLEPAAVEQVGSLLLGVTEDVRALEQVLAQCLGVVGGLGRQRGQCLQPLGDGPRGSQFIGPLGRHHAHVDEPFDHLDEPGAGPLGPADRVVPRRRADEARQERAFDHAELADRLTEVHLRCGLQPVGVVAEEDRVDVPLEDLVLGELLVEHQRVVGLQQLVPTVALQTGKELVLHHLLGDGAGTLARRVAGEVRQRGTDEAAHIHALVHVELVVLHRQDGAHHVGGHARQRDRLAVLAFEHGDHVAGDVVGDAALRQRLELGQIDWQFLVSVGHLPQARRGPDHHGGDEQRSRADDGCETEEPGNGPHDDRTLVVLAAAQGSPPIGAPPYPGPHTPEG